MIIESELPSSQVERAAMLENLMVARATGDLTASSELYEHLRREFLEDAALKDMLPSFVRTCRTLDVFWPYIKQQAGSYADRRAIIGQAFTPLMDYLEGRNAAPLGAGASETLASFDADGVHVIWEKALNRRHTDPEGAITVARTLLETVCKRILDLAGIPYAEKEDLPKLYSLVAKFLNLAPDQHTEEPIKAILGGAMSLVNGIGTLRNRLDGMNVDLLGRPARKQSHQFPALDFRVAIGRGQETDAVSAIDEVAEGLVIPAGNRAGDEDRASFLAAHQLPLGLIVPGVEQHAAMRGKVLRPVGRSPIA